MSSFSGNLSNELKKTKKYYFYDGGIVNSLLKNFAALPEREMSGFLLEAFVFRHLLSQLKENMELRFWRTRTGEEIDLILLKDQVPYPIEVKMKRKGLRELKGMKKFLHAYPRVTHAFCITFDEEGHDYLEGKDIFTLPCDRVSEIFDNIR